MFDLQRRELFTYLERLECARSVGQGWKERVEKIDDFQDDRMYIPRGHSADGKLTEGLKQKFILPLHPQGMAFQGDFRTSCPSPACQF